AIHVRHLDRWCRNCDWPRRQQRCGCDRICYLAWEWADCVCDCEPSITHPIASDDPDEQPIGKTQFSLRSLLIITTAVGCWFGVLRIAPHVAILLLGIALAALSTWLLIRSWRPDASPTFQVSAYMFAAVAWTLLYVLSIGPVVAIVGTAGGPLDNGLRAFYTPVKWLHDTTPLKELLEAYGRLWGWK
ncbi:MAG: hypothetical protein ACR2NM_16045, partial [Bythopirellula sp.]